MRSATESTTGLTKAQRALVESEPTLAAEAAAAAVKGMGAGRFNHLRWEDLVANAQLGVVEAAVTYDPARGFDYRSWAFFGAVHAVLQSGRDEHAQHAKAKAMIQASVLMYFRDLRVERDPGFETDSSLTGKLHSCSNPVLGLAMMELATSSPTSGGEDAALDRVDAARAGAVLREVLPAEGTDERRMLQLHFRKNLTLVEVAAAMGIHTVAGSAAYRAFVRRFHDVLASLRERMERRGIRELPPWHPEVFGQVLREDEE